MNTEQIDKCLRSALSPDLYFAGVFSRDKIPSGNQRFPSCLVANIDKAKDPGSHWVAFYIDSPKEVEFFDSYGEAPTTYSISPLLCFGNTSTAYNNRILQSESSSVCGQYCIYYLIQKSRGYSLQTIISHLSPYNLRWNDKLVAQFALRYASVYNEASQNSSCANQNCKSRQHFLCNNS